jgi:hypothetical protein
MHPEPLLVSIKIFKFLLTFAYKADDNKSSLRHINF